MDVDVDEGVVDEDVVALWLLLETEFLINIIMVTASLGVLETRCKLQIGCGGSCNSEQTTGEVALELGATEKLSK